MDIAMIEQRPDRVESFLDGIGEILGNPQRRENFARYAELGGTGDRR